MELKEQDPTGLGPGLDPPGATAAVAPAAGNPLPESWRPTK